ncbi:MAG: glycosyltransferase family 2 protein [Verrucomicrobiales bacterium]|nr:glycosyltransferase family 2 protein [Verrucomicrobiales bacterium]
MASSALPQPLVTIVIPTYNRANTVVASVESALAQTYPHREILVVDDGSKDDTSSRLEPYRDRVRYIHQNNAGKSAAMNRALKEARGTWFGILDSDDLWMPEKLALQIEGLGQHDGRAGLSFTDGIYMGNPSLAPEVVGTFFKQSFKSFPSLHGFIEDAVNYVLKPPHGIFGQSTLIRCDLLREVGGFDEALVMAEDTDILFRVALKTSFTYVNQPLVKVDRTPTRKEGLAKIYARVTPMAVRCRTHLYEKWLAMNPPITEPQRTGIRARLAAVYHDAALIHLVENRRRDALAAFRRASSLDAKFRYVWKRWLTLLAPPLARQFLTRST